MPVVTRRQKAINDFVKQFETEGEDFFNELLRTTANVYADKYGIKGLKSEDICTELTMLCQSIHSALAVKFCETLKDEEEEEDGRYSCDICGQVEFYKVADTWVGECEGTCNREICDECRAKQPLDEDGDPGDDCICQQCFDEVNEDEEKEESKCLACSLPESARWLPNHKCTGWYGEECFYSWDCANALCYKMMKDKEEKDEESA